MNTIMFTPTGMRISTPTSILTKTRNTATSILTCMIMNTNTSTFTSIRTREHQMFTIMSIKVNMVLTIMNTPDTRQKFIAIRIRRKKPKLECKWGNFVSIMEVKSKHN
jgi:hypothetical protein